MFTFLFVSLVLKVKFLTIIALIVVT